MLPSPTVLAGKCDINKFFQSERLSLVSFSVVELLLLSKTIKMDFSHVAAHIFEVQLLYIYNFVRAES